MTGSWNWQDLRLPEAFTVAVAAYQREKLESLRATIDQAIEEGIPYQDLRDRIAALPMPGLRQVREPGVGS